MNNLVERAKLLMSQSKFDMAEKELKQALAYEPEEPFIHSLLALCLLRQEKWNEAETAAQQAVHFGPDQSLSHYSLAAVLFERHKEREALPVIQEAIRLDPSDPDLYALLGQIHFSRSHWQDALTAAEQGLQQDPEHIVANNIRAMALVKLNRLAEAGATIDVALQKNPENSYTHANMGWTLLEKSEPAKALEHFRESLRLDPENEWARQGIIEAMKARYMIYAIMLKFFLWMGKLPPKMQVGVVIGGYFLFRMLGNISNRYPEWAPYALPLQILYIAFALMSWIANPLFNLLLRLNRFGRLVLSPEQVRASNYIGLFIFISLTSLLTHFIYDPTDIFLFSAALFGAMLIPTSAIFSCQQGWPRKMMTLYTGVIVSLALAMLGIFTFAQYQETEMAKQWIRQISPLLSLFVIGVIGAPWVANFLILQRPKR
jgi:tetratricopeptide (TPR) repeat protein